MKFEDFTKMLNFLILAALTVSMFTASFCYAEKMKQTEVPKMQVARKVKFLAFSGSTRKDSYNTKALKLLAKAASNADAEVTMINLKDYTMPLYDGDLESTQDLPENTKKLQRLIVEHDGLLIASPEYNGLPSPLLKNVLDWASRTDKSNPNLGIKIFENKVAALISASPSRMGGVRGLQIAAQLLSNLGLIVVPERVMIGNCPESFNANGEITDKYILEQIEKEGRAVTKLARALKRESSVE